MADLPSEHLETLGLGGDGDEVDAITNVERRFGVVLDYGDASKWVTVGDVFTSLLKALPPEQRERDELWMPFAEAISDETGADPAKVGADTLLLSLPLRELAARRVRQVFRPSD